MTDTPTLPEAPAVIRFTATWCAPCQSYAPVFDKVLADYPGIETQVLDISSPEVARLALQNKVLGVPATLFITNKHDEPPRAMGGMPEQQLRDLLQGYFGPPF